MTPEQRLAAVQRLAAAFSAPACAINIHAVWENEHGRAGIYTYDVGAAVFLNNAQQDVAGLDEAQDVLRRIFADEIVAVTAYGGGDMMYCVLGPASDPSANFPRRESKASNRQIPDIDDVTIECWSSGLVEQDD